MPLYLLIADHYAKCYKNMPDCAGRPGASVRQDGRGIRHKQPKPKNPMKHPKSAEKACPTSELQPENPNPTKPNPAKVGTSRCDVPARVQRAERSSERPRSAHSVAPLNAARPACATDELRPGKTAQRAVPTQSACGAVYRNGKIARLPVEIRDALNRRLVAGVPGPKLLEWLNGLPEARAMLHEHFNDQPISPQNLSQWRGGFRDWLLKEEAKEVFREFATHHQNLDALELNEKVALWLGTRLVAMAGCVDQQSPEESWPVVREMIRDVATLRRGDHRIREQRFKEKAKQAITDQDHLDWAMEPERLEWLCEYAGEHGNDAITEKLGKFIFHEHWRKKPSAPGTFPGAQQPPLPAAETPNTKNQAPKGEKVQSSEATSNEIKVDQTKSKCDAGPPAAETSAYAQKQLRRDEPNTKNQAPKNSQASPPPVGLVGPVGQSEAAGTSCPPAPAQAKAPVASAPRVPTRPASFQTRCHCGAKGAMSAAECPNCQLRLSIGMPCCPCHLAVPDAKPGQT